MWAMELSEFRAWLELQPASREFSAGVVDSCPLACYLHDSGYPTAYVRPFQYFLSKGTLGIPLPPWAAYVVFRVDGAGLRTLTVPQVQEIVDSINPRIGDR